MWASECLTNFQKEEKKWNVMDSPEEQQQTTLNLKMKTLGELCGQSATLCMAIASLIYVQDTYAEDETIIELTRNWQTAAKKTNEDINKRLQELAGTETLEDDIPKNDSELWIGSWYLGVGSFGRASMYVQLGDPGNIINRVVVKECVFNQNERQKNTWDKDPSFFSKDHTGARVPTEVMTMFDLRGKQGSGYIVKILNWRITRKRRLYRLYLEVCSSVWQSMMQTTDHLVVCKPSQHASRILVSRDVATPA